MVCLFNIETTARNDLECEFPPRMEEDLTHIRRKRLTTKNGLVCLEDYPYTVSIRDFGGRILSITDIKRHPDYRMDQYYPEHNLALVKVTGQLREGENQELRRMIVREVPRPSCRLIYGNDYHLQHDHICLQSVVKGVALCAGDTGDPAVHFSGINRAGTLYGIALFSGTEECAYKSKPGVSYSRLWIDKIIGETLEHNESADSGENAIPLDLDR
ncbi:unnamed protein product [Diatraea saccharalis]|uniref:Peptidase S1 domain-containing protein n=1 Tax=Diatraea saccharalis TaxID=40085 RepID=A0A9N9WFJ4_9NEOP|nr:unnamed protein product [Diatraea saccharalis]